MLVTFLQSRQRLHDARDGGRECRLVTVSVGDCTSTLSVAGVLKPACCRMFSAFAVSPEACSESVSMTLPTAVPITSTAIPTANHPNVAVFQCAALQRPARPAKLVRSMTPLSFSDPTCL